MAQRKTHKNCRLFSYESCAHKNHEVMKKATQDIPQYYGGNYAILSFPQDEEIDAICANCDKFTQK
jgi:hypothetical protein